MGTLGAYTCLTLTGQRMASTPKRFFEAAIEKSLHVPIMPGTVVRLEKPIGDIDAG